MSKKKFMGGKRALAAAVLGLTVTMGGAAAWGQETAETSELDAIIVSADRLPTPGRRNRPV